MQIKPRYDNTAIRIAKIRTLTNAGEDVKKHSLQVGMQNGGGLWKTRG